MYIVLCDERNFVPLKTPINLIRPETGLDNLHSLV